ncbi:dr1-associated corepressor [Silurus meridionalis]|nr:dr1-associated corepressor [Silurus meridionalis]
MVSSEVKWRAEWECIGTRPERSPVSGWRRKEAADHNSFQTIVLDVGVYFCRKQCIELEQQFDFLKDLVAAVPDMQGEGDENHAEGAERIPRRGRKPGSGRKNGGAGAKGKDKKLSGTESEQEDDSEDSETDGDEEDIPQPNAHHQAASHFHSPDMPPPYMPMGAPQATLAMPISSFGSQASVMGMIAPPPATAPHKEHDDDEDYDS